MNESISFTGERFHPEKAGEMWYEHWHRYHVVAPLVSGLRVLDVACGEGYGSDRLAQTAKDVGGIDVSDAAIAHAQRTYTRANLSFQQGDCTAIPVADACVDVVVSFETLEHIEQQDAFVSEVARVLAPGGWAVISTPNKAEYSDARGYANEFHVKELYRNEFEGLVRRHFSHVRWLTQRNGFHSIIAEESGASQGALDASLRIESMQERAGQRAAPLYYLAFVAQDQATLDKLPLGTSAFTAFEDTQVDSFMQIWRHSQHLEKRVAELEARLASGTPTSPTPPPSQTLPPAAESWLERTLKKLSQ